MLNKSSWILKLFFSDSFDNNKVYIKYIFHKKNIAQKYDFH